MSKFTENVFNERKRLRNAVLSNNDWFNEISNSVKLIYSKREDADSDFSILKHNERSYLILNMVSRYNVDTLYVLSFGKKEKINIDNIKISVKEDNIEADDNFVLSLIKEKDCLDVVTMTAESISRIPSSVVGDKKVFLSEKLKNVNFNSTKNVKIFVEFIKFINEKINIESIISYSEKENIKYGYKVISGLISRIERIKKIARKNYKLFYNLKIKIKDGILLIKNENDYVLAIDLKGKDLSIYDLDHISIENVILGKTGNLPCCETLIKMKDGQIICFYKEYYSMVIKHILDNIYQVALKDEKIKVEDYYEEMLSLDYQKKLFGFMFDSDEFDVVVSAFLKKSDFKYNEKERSFVSKSYGYVTGLENVKEKPKHQLSLINNYDPLKNNLYVLNDEWMDAIERSLKILREEMPLPLTHYGKTPESSLLEAIEYLEILLEYNNR